MKKALRLALTALLISSSALCGALAQAAPSLQHTVQKGDTAYSISKKYGLTLEQLLSWNNLADSSVKVGQVLTVQASVVEPEENAVSVEPSSESIMPLIRVQAARLPSITGTSSESMPRIVAPALKPDVSKPDSSLSSPKPPELKILNGSSHTVQKGETAFSISKKYGLTLERLLSLNGLSSTQLRVGQVLQVVENAPPLEPSVSAPAGLKTYRVQKGDTLFSLSRRFGVSVSALREANGFGSSDLKGDLNLIIPAPLETVSEPPNENPLPFPDTAEGNSPWRKKALSLLGVPYVYGGKTARGTDCSGFVLQVMAEVGITLPRRSSDQYSQGEVVDRADLQAGDLVFFDTVGAGNISHVGIYMGEGQFINANSYLEKVAMDDLNSSYWTPRYRGAKRVLFAQSLSRAN